MSELHIAARTAMHQAAVVLANLADARNATLDVEEMALIQARLSDMNRAFVETGLLAAPAQELSALPELPRYDLVENSYGHGYMTHWDKALDVRAIARAAMDQVITDSVADIDGNKEKSDSFHEGKMAGIIAMKVAIDAAIQAQAGDANGGA